MPPRTIQNARRSFLLETLFVILVASHMGCGAERQFSLDLFEGFKPMSLPQTGVHVGSKWKDGTGPVSESHFSEEELQVARSLQRIDAFSTSSLTTNIKYSLAQALGIEASVAKTMLSSITLDELEIVRPKKFLSLKPEVGSTYLWEAIRARKFSVRSFDRLNAELDLSLENPTSHGLRAKVSQDGKVVTYFSGEGLYVAYRVVRLGEPENMEIARRSLTKDMPLQFDLGERYRLRLVPMPREENFPIDIILLPPYMQKDGPSVPLMYWMIKVIYNDILTESGEHAYKYLPVLLTPADVGRHRLGTWYKDEGVIIDYLHVDKMDAKTKIIRINTKTTIDERGYQQESDTDQVIESINADFRVVRRTMPFETVRNPYAPGW